MSRFDSLIEQKAFGHEAKVPPDAWANIMKKKKKRRFGFFWLFAGIMIVGVISVLFMRNSNGKQKVVTDKISDNPGQVQYAAEKSAEPKISVDMRTMDKDNFETSAPEAKVEQRKNSFNSDQDAVTNNADRVKMNQKLDAFEKMPRQRIKQIPATANLQELLGAKPKSKKSNGKMNISVTAGQITDDEQGPINNPEKQIAGKQKMNIKAGEVTTLDTDLKTETGDAKDKKTALEVSRDKLSGTESQEKNNIISVTPEAERALDSLPAKQLVVIKTAPGTKPVESAKKDHGWYVDAALAPVFAIENYDQSTTFRRVTNLSAMQNTEFNGKLVETETDPSIAFSVAVRKSINNKFQAGVGVRYIQLKEFVAIEGAEKTTRYEVIKQLTTISGVSQLVDDTVAYVTQGSRKIRALNSYRFVSMPVYLRYYLKNSGSWKVAADMGIVVDIWRRYQNEINSTGAIISSSSMLESRSTNIGYSISMSAARAFGKRTELFLKPGFLWYPQQPGMKNSLLQKRIQQAELGVGISYKIH